jgi:hypothetical protein
MGKLSITMPSPLPGSEVKRTAATCGGFGIDDIAKYVARYNLDEPDLIELDTSLQLLRRMLLERGFFEDSEGL